MSHVGIFGGNTSREYEVPAGMAAPETFQRTVPADLPIVEARTQPREMTPQERMGYRKALEYRLKQEGKTLPANLQPVPRAYEPAPSTLSRPVPYAPPTSLTERQDAIGYRARLAQRRQAASSQPSFVAVPAVATEVSLPSEPVSDLEQQTLAALTQIAAQFPARATITTTPEPAAPEPIPIASTESAVLDTPVITPLDADTPQESTRKRRRRGRTSVS